MELSRPAAPPERKSVSPSPGSRPALPSNLMKGFEGISPPRASRRRDAAGSPSTAQGQTCGGFHTGESRPARGGTGTQETPEKAQGETGFFKKREKERPGRRTYPPAGEKENVGRPYEVEFRWVLQPPAGLSGASVAAHPTESRPPAPGGGGRGENQKDLRRGATARRRRGRADAPADPVGITSLTNCPLTFSTYTSTVIFHATYLH